MHLTKIYSDFPERFKQTQNAGQIYKIVHKARVTVMAPLYWVRSARINQGEIWCLWDHLIMIKQIMTQIVV